jgi:DNA polymerase-1
VDEEAITRLLHLPSLDDQKKKFLEALMERRGVKKLLSTYVEGMQEKLDHGRLHTTFRITGTVTGRLSSASPNLQNIPRGPQVRNLFAASPGKVLLEADYSQIELRMGAFLTRDERMLKLLRDGVDLHTATGEAIYGRKVTKEERYLAKTVNFGIFYGMGPRRLVEETGMALSTARSFIRSWYDLYPGVAAWQKEVEKELISKGEIEGLFGRKRHLEVAVDKDEYLEQVRMACNFPVQNAAAELTLMALGLLSSGLQLPLVLTVHDSILCEVPQDKTQEWSGHIRRTMTNANDLIRAFGFKLKLDVPILVEIKSGKYWGSMKEVSHA